MPVQSALTLNSLSYVPRGTTNGISLWVYPGGVSFGGGQSSLTESVRPFNVDGVSNGRWVLQAEKLAAEDSPCACLGASLGNGKVDTKVTIHRSLTPAERLDLYERYKSAVASDAFKKAFTDLEPSWG